MNSKKVILIIIVVLIAICLVLAWFILRGQTEEKILQSSSFIEMFGDDSIGLEQDIPNTFRANMKFDIIGISNENNGRAMATINVTMPDLARVLRVASEYEQENNPTYSEMNVRILSYTRVTHLSTQSHP